MERRDEQRNAKGASSEKPVLPTMQAPRLEELPRGDERRGRPPSGAAVWDPEPAGPGLMFGTSRGCPTCRAAGCGCAAASRPPERASLRGGRTTRCLTRRGSGSAGRRACGREW